jgi:hypothetical protein
MVIVTTEWPENFDQQFEFSWAPVLEAFAIDTIEIIKARTEKGLDVNGKTFKGYSDSYFKYKTEIGHTPYSIGDWLYLTGQMIRSLTFNLLDDLTVDIGFSGVRTQKAPKVGRKTLKRGPRKGQTVTWGKQSEAIDTKTTASQTNANVAFHANETRKFFGVTEAEVEVAVKNSIKQLGVKEWQSTSTDAVAE